jgi:heme exporter protein A
VVVSPPSLVLEDIRKIFGQTKVLRGVTLTVGRGERVLLTGPNGAGKTTLLRIISSQTSPSSGRVTVEGVDISKDRQMAKRLVGIVGHRSFLYDELTVEENLRFYGSFYRVGEDEIAKVLETTNIGAWLSTRVGHLSYGLTKRADIARALLGKPRVLAMDELFSGLDNESSMRVFRSLKEFDGTIILSSHTREYSEELCGREITLRDGMIEGDTKL